MLLVPRMQLNERFVIKKTEKSKNQAVEGNLLYSNHNDDTCRDCCINDKDINRFALRIMKNDKTIKKDRLYAAGVEIGIHT